ncbi:MAG: hypothetical protein HYV09_15535 [Deltaproteobacteria bacterium]|nr:hypothetical protein [Deltaproteobacteria bacterium]
MYFLLLVGGCAAQQPACEIDPSKCAEDSDCPAGLIAVPFTGTDACRRDVCREQHCTTEVVPEGTGVSDNALGLAPNEWCVRYRCFGGTPRRTLDPWLIPPDEGCKRHHCDGVPVHGVAPMSVCSAQLALCPILLRDA